MTKIAFAIYANRESGTSARTEGDLGTLAWIDDSLAESSIARWMRATLPRGATSIRVNSALTLKLAAEAGLGVVALPCYL